MIVQARQTYICTRIATIYVCCLNSPRHRERGNYVARCRASGNGLSTVIRSL